MDVVLEQSRLGSETLNSYHQQWSVSSGNTSGIPPILRDFNHHMDDLDKDMKKSKRDTKNLEKLGIKNRKNQKILNASRLTMRAAGLGVALAAADGPLPVGDVIGFTIFVGVSAYAWGDVFFGD